MRRELGREPSPGARMARLREMSAVGGGKALDDLLGPLVRQGGELADVVTALAKKGHLTGVGGAPLLAVGRPRCVGGRLHAHGC